MDKAAPIAQNDTMNSTSPVRRLHRSSSDRVVGGVCGGLAAYFNIDPVIVRIAAVVAAIFSGGAGVFAYIGAWIFIPEGVDAELQGEGRARRPRVHRDRKKIIGAVLLGLGAINLLDRIGFGFRSDVTWPLALIGIGAAVLWSRRASTADGADVPPFDDGPVPSRPEDAVRASGWAGHQIFGASSAGRFARGSPTSVEPRVESSDDGSVRDSNPPTVAERDPLLEEADRLDAEMADVNRMAEERLHRSVPATTRPGLAALSPVRRPTRSSRVGPVAFGGVLLACGALGVMSPLGIAHPNAVVFLGASLFMVGIGLVAGTWLGRPRGFIFLGLVLAGALATTALFDIRWSGSVGEFTYAPPSSGALRPEYQVFAGQVGLDLRAGDFGGRSTDVNAEVGFGQLVVLVPSKVRVEVDAKLGAGELTAFGETKDGLQPRLNRVSRGASSADGVLRLHLKGGAGQIEVARSGQLIHASFPTNAASATPLRRISDTSTIPPFTSPIPPAPLSPTTFGGTAQTPAQGAR